MQAKIIDTQHPYHGLVCTVGEMGTNGLYPVSPMEEPFRSGYARPEQLQPIEPCTCSECRWERARAHDTGGIFTDHNGWTYPYLGE